MGTGLIVCAGDDAPGLVSHERLVWQRQSCAAEDRCPRDAGANARWVAGANARWVAGAYARWVAGAYTRWVAGAYARWFAGAGP